MKIWITKYALTKGIYEADAKIDGNMATVRNPNSQWDQYFHYHKIDTVFKARQAGQGGVRRDRARQARHGGVRHGTVPYGMARQARFG